MNVLVPSFTPFNIMSIAEILTEVLAQNQVRAT